MRLFLSHIAFPLPVENSMKRQLGINRNHMKSPVQWNLGSSDLWWTNMPARQQSLCPNLLFWTRPHWKNCAWMIFCNPVSPLFVCNVSCILYKQRSFVSWISCPAIYINVAGTCWYCPISQPAGHFNLAKKTCALTFIKYIIQSALAKPPPQKKSKKNIHSACGFLRLEQVQQSARLADWEIFGIHVSLWIGIVETHVKPLNIILMDHPKRAQPPCFAPSRVTTSPKRARNATVALWVRPKARSAKAQHLRKWIAKQTIESRLWNNMIESE